MSKQKESIGFKAFAKRCLFCFIIIYLGVLLISQQFNISRLNRELDDITEQCNEATKETVELQAEFEASGTDEYAERVAREKLGYMKPYEKVFIDSSK